MYRASNMRVTCFYHALKWCATWCVTQLGSSTWRCRQNRQAQLGEPARRKPSRLWRSKGSRTLAMSTTQPAQAMVGRTDKRGVLFAASTSRWGWNLIQESNGGRPETNPATCAKARSAVEVCPSQRVVAAPAPSEVEAGFAKARSAVEACPPLESPTSNIVEVGRTSMQHGGVCDWQHSGGGPELARA